MIVRTRAFITRNRKNQSSSETPCSDSLKKTLNSLSHEEAQHEDDMETAHNMTM